MPEDYFRQDWELFDLSSCWFDKDERLENCNIKNINILGLIFWLLFKFGTIYRIDVGIRYSGDLNTKLVWYSNG